MMVINKCPERLNDIGQDYKKKRIILLMFVMLTLSLFGLTTSTAQSQSLGIFQQNTCINLKQICSNCTYVNVSSVIYPNATQALSQSAMTKIGTEYNYTFCSTDALGDYIVSGFGDIDGVVSVWSYDFLVSVSGTTPSIVQGILYSIVLLFFVMLLLLSFFFSITITAKNVRNDEGKVVQVNWKKPLKFFLWFMNYALLLLIIGILYDISINYFETINGIKTFLGIIFEWGVGLTLPVLGLTMAMIVITWVADKKIQKTLSRGVPMRG